MSVRRDHDATAVRVVCERCGREQWNRLGHDALMAKCENPHCFSFLGVYADGPAPPPLSVRLAAVPLAKDAGSP